MTDTPHLPLAWVEKLHARLLVRYGDAFAKQYEGLEMDAVRKDWAIVLGAYVNRPAALHWALENLLPDRPPNAMQFRNLAGCAPRQEERPVLQHSRAVRPTHEQMDALRRVATVIGRGPAPGDSPAQRVLDGLLTFEARTGRRLTGAQREAIRELRLKLGRSAETDADADGVLPDHAYGHEPDGVHREPLDLRREPLDLRREPIDLPQHGSVA